MRIGQILEEIGDGLTKDHVYYWEKAGFLRPNLIKKAKIERREYSEDDLKRIKLVWKYVNEGFSLKASFNRAIVELENEQVDINKFNELTEYMVRSAPRELNESAYKILRLLQNEFSQVNTIIGMSGRDLILLGALATLAYEKKLFYLIPLVFNPLIFDYGINQKNKAVIITDSFANVGQIIEVVNKLQLCNSEVLGLIHTGAILSDEEIKKLPDLGLKAIHMGIHVGSYRELSRKSLKTVEYTKSSLK